MEHRQSLLSKALEHHGFDADDITETEMFRWMCESSEKFTALELALAEQLAHIAKAFCAYQDKVEG